MMRASSNSDIASGGPPSSASPRAYYVQSPSADSDIDKCSSNNPCLSPSDPRHSLTSSSTVSTAASRIFGNQRRLWSKQYYCDVVVEKNVEVDDNLDCEDDGDGNGDEDYYGSRAYYKHWNAMILGVTFVLVFVGFCWGVWGVSLHYKAQVSIKSIWIENVHYGEGLDHTGVLTKLMTVNCSANLVIHNPATYFGIQVSSHTASLIFSQITVASGQLKKYYQPRKSTRMIRVMLVGKEVPLYGAGMELDGSDGISMQLEVVVESKGTVLGELVTTRHTVRFSCKFYTHIHRAHRIKNACR